MEKLFEYSIAITPGLILAAAVIAVLPRKEIALRIAVLILGFILMRDALLPFRLWQITDNFEMRFSGTVYEIWMLALFAGGIAYALRWVIDMPTPTFVKVCVWRSILFGTVGSFIVYVPVLLARHFGSGPSELPKLTETSFLIAVLAVCILGNFLEEILFRGYLQNYLRGKETGEGRAILLSALIFSLCHIFLASTVTQIGWPILFFTAFEGVICALLASRYGLLSATLAHGLGIFWIATN